MKIVLAGYNVEVDVLKKRVAPAAHEGTGNSVPDRIEEKKDCFVSKPSQAISKNHQSLHEEILTPEIFSSAYARISRSSKDIISLREQARKDVKKARESNKTIIFEMGHHSVAEHAVFNFDIIGVSRLALEEIERFRLGSYTEKSQRYVTLKGDFVLPKEITAPEDRDLFREIIELQNGFYKKSLAILQDYHFAKSPEVSEKKEGRRLLKNLAKEDARYILALASEGQVGLTINARNLEHLFRRFHLSPREEVRQVGKDMYNLVYGIAPSIFLFAEPSQFEKDLHGSFKRNFLLPDRNELPEKPSKSEPDQKLLQGVKGGGFLEKSPPYRRRYESIATNIIRYTEKGDDIILASFLSIYNSISYDRAYEIITGMTAAEKENIYKDLFKNMAFFDSPPREFELADITFQAVISASNFAQLKRHRMATLITGDYDIYFGNMIPETIKINGLEDEFNTIIEKTNNAYLTFKERYNEAADYILTNSHRRMLIMKMNLREVYHFIRLRDDEHAQWEIREMAGEILRGVKRVMPFATMLLCGKSNFDDQFKKIFPAPHAWGGD